MTKETEVLLLKVRKGATASFGLSHWRDALGALGFKVEATKVGREIVRVDFTFPGQTEPSLHEVKREGYRCVTFYDVERSLREWGVQAKASEALGLPTVENEKALKDLYERDLTNTGTCGVCGGNLKREADGGLHLHGYKRPGDGMLHGRCFGVGYQPFELDPASCVQYLAQRLRPMERDTAKHLSLLKADKVEWFQVRSRTDFKTWVIVRRSDGYEFTQARKSDIFNTERNLEMLRADIVHFDAKVAGWKLDVLPEVKHAGLFAKGGAR